MALVLNEEQVMLKDAARDFLRGRAPVSHLREIRDSNNQDGFSRELWAEMVEMGWSSILVPEEHGGFDLDPETEVRTFALIAEEVARGDSGLADKLVQNWKVAILLREVAPKDLVAPWFRRLRDDPGFLLAHALTEPRGASDRWLPYNAPEAAMQTRAVRDGDHWVLNGRKQYISNGYDAGLYVVYANTDRTKGMLQGTSSFLIPRDTPGFTVSNTHSPVL